MSEENVNLKKFNELQSDYDDLEEIPLEHKRRKSEEKRIESGFTKLLKVVQGAPNKDGKLKKAGEFEIELLQWGDDRELLKPIDRERLYEYERDNLAKGSAIVIQKTPPGYKLRLNDVVKWFKGFDSKKKKTVYSFFVENQRRRTGSKADYIKVARGDMSMEELPNEGRVETLKFRLIKSQFNKYFEVEDAA